MKKVFIYIISASLKCRDKLFKGPHCRILRASINYATMSHRFFVNLESALYTTQGAGPLSPGWTNLVRVFLQPDA